MSMAFLNHIPYMGIFAILVIYTRVGYSSRENKKGPSGLYPDNPLTDEKGHPGGQCFRNPESVPYSDGSEEMTQDKSGRKDNDQVSAERDDQ